MIRLLNIRGILGNLAAWWVVGVGVHCLPAPQARSQQVRVAAPGIDEVPARVPVPAVALDHFFDDALDDPFGVPGAGAVVPEKGPFLAPEVVNQWIFGGNLQPEDGRKRLEHQLQLHLEELTEHCELTSDQITKLRRAGRGDIARFLRRVADVQRVVAGPGARADMARLISDHVQPLQQVLQTGPFDENSLLVKTTVRTLDASQRAAYEELVRRRTAAMFGARVELAVAMMERQVPLLDRQRTELVEWIAENVPPTPVRRNDLDLPWIYYHMSKLPEQRAMLILEGPQQEMFKVFLQRMRNQRQILFEAGLLNDADR